MKLRRLSLINYIAFLGVMYIVWYLTIQAKKHGGYDLSQTNDLIEKLEFSLMPSLYFYIEESYTQQQFESFNKTIYKEFKQYNLNIIHHLRESDQQQQQQKQQFVIQLYNDNRNEINIVKLNQIEIFTTQTNSVHLVKNLKRFLNKYITKDQRQIDSQQIYLEKHFVFEFYIVDKLKQVNLVQQIDQTIKNLMNTFELPIEHYRMNYKYIKLEDFELNNLEFKNILKGHSQINSMIWQDYYQLNILLIQDDDNNNTLIYDKEDYQFVFQEPNNFIHYQRNQEMLMENLFDTFLQLLDLEEQIEIIFDESDYQTDLQILVQHFKLREQQRLYNNFIRELNYMKFIQSEGDYKITTESQQQFEYRQEYIKSCLNNNNIYSNNSVNILIDDRFSDLDTFSFEYTMGTYLPIILPFAYPIILGIYDEVTAQ